MASTDPDHEPTHFEILSLSARSLDGQGPDEQSEIVKKAYRRALLKHHPDKQAQTSAEKSDASSATYSQHFTVDQITEAYNVLSDEQQRRKYTRNLRAQSKATFSSNARTTTRGSRKAKTAQVETVNLDDLSWSGKRRLYYHACQGCGKARGFTLREDDIEDEDEDYELMIECSGCEKELKVVVPALVDGPESSQGEGVNYGLAAQQSQTQNQAPQRNNENTEPQKKSRGWGIRLGLGLGLSLGGGGSASAGRS
ncbi:Diphthamide biosynthesis protein 4 [Gnomoniopsis smithogilvyi]|uniref:Diphthamide biosynthesis protein 4 n=1 Tax=Gnomoniopsis smithogilvyi TaxID=1191159 RepID=A0A9W8YR35_9PEZI|nr:Diphthamide biosynthesis protein 4 [Gnomoniopsis smithogilvyi]